ncbi:MAG TPA: DUF1501 domain-containing protein [Flavobacteriales bacterium]|nr:DUF1501 domain-containing protein [Flavobacteriales bacterium]
MKRRAFIQSGALVSTAMLVPRFLIGFPIGSGEHTANRLIVVQLSGGNDGLNTVIPYEDDLYFRARPMLAVESSKVLRLNDEQGLNPVMKGLEKWYHEGYVTILNSVGYPNPNRSHFRSMDIWHTASDSDKTLSTGWLGRYIDAACGNGAPLSHAIEVNSTLSLAMKGHQYNGLALSKPKQLYGSTNDPFIRHLVNTPNTGADERDFLYKTLAETASTARYIYEKSKVYTSNQEYPQSAFGKNLKNIAQLIISGCHSQVYYVSLGGFDTHNQQSVKQARLLQQFSEGMDTLLTDLKNNQAEDNVLIMVFSEFGRRVKENASKGTDHGTANNVFVLGKALRQPGIYNPTPSLADLDKGDLNFQIDFRSVYSTLLRNWLKTNDVAILGHDFPTLDLV